MSIYYGAESDSDDDTVVLLERFSRPSPWSKTPATQAFHLFPSLPAELRARVWAIALHNQIEYVDDLDFDRPNEVRIHEEKGKIIVNTFRGYPPLFFVNREARYEAAKVDGGTWHSLAGVKIYANLAKEDIKFFTCYRSGKSGNRGLIEGFKVFSCTGHQKWRCPW